MRNAMYTISPLKERISRHCHTFTTSNDTRTVSSAAYVLVSSRRGSKRFFRSGFSSTQSGVGRSLKNDTHLRKKSEMYSWREAGWGLNKQSGVSPHRASNILAILLTSFWFTLFPFCDVFNWTV